MKDGQIAGLYMDTKIDAVVPCYRVGERVVGVVRQLLNAGIIKTIIVVDDACPEKSGMSVENEFRDNNRVVVLTNKTNLGVGGAVLAGYKYAFDHGADIVVKIDGDGQMDPKHIARLARPVMELKCDYAKGNRFFYPKHLKGMPKLRFIGNSALSIINKFTSGYWSIMDPTNGFTAIHRVAYGQLSIDKLANDYFFESDMLFQLSIANAVVLDVPIPAIYQDETSSLNISKVLVKFPGKYINRMLQRIAFKYFIRDFNIASLELICGGFLFFSGMLFGFYQWISHMLINQETPAGTVMIFGLTVILGFQLLLSALNYDIWHEPSTPLVQREVEPEVYSAD